MALAKDADALLKGGSDIYETCVACHMKYIAGQQESPAPAQP
jgi:hypothetical protein